MGFPVDKHRRAGWFEDQRNHGLLNASSDDANVDVGKCILGVLVGTVQPNQDCFDKHQDQECWNGWEQIIRAIFSHGHNRAGHHSIGKNATCCKKDPTREFHLFFFLIFFFLLRCLFSSPPHPLSLSLSLSLSPPSLSGSERHRWWSFLP